MRQPGRSRKRPTQMEEFSEYLFTIIVPVYNEQDNMDALENALSGYLRGSDHAACVLFVDDGSTDGSLRRIVEMCRRNPDFHYLALASNGGLSTALKAGIDVARTPLIGYMDADLQTAPEDFDLLLPFAGDYALVSGVRFDRRDGWGKRMQSRVANAFRRMMTGDKATDTGCPLKVMQTVYARRIPFFKGLHRFLPAMMLLQRGKVKEVPVRHFPRMAGVSKYRLWNRLTAPLADCFAYRWMRSRYIDYRIVASSLPADIPDRKPEPVRRAAVQPAEQMTVHA